MSQCARPVPLEELDETSIVARAQDGDLSAFEYLVDNYQGRLFRLAFRMLNDRLDAEDAVQDVLITAWRKLPLMARPEAFSSWVYRTTANRCLDILRQRKVNSFIPVDDDGLERHVQRADGMDGRSGSVDPAAEAETTAQLRDLARALESVTPEQRICWLLREIHGQSYEEIATILQITPTAVRGRIARARVQLAERMTPWQ